MSAMFCPACGEDHVDGMCQECQDEYCEECLRLPPYVVTGTSGGKSITGLLCPQCFELVRRKFLANGGENAT